MWFCLLTGPWLCRWIWGNPRKVWRVMKRALQRTLGPPIFKGCQPLRSGPGRCWRTQKILCLKSTRKERTFRLERELLMGQGSWEGGGSRLFPGKERKAMKASEGQMGRSWTESAGCGEEVCKSLWRGWKRGPGVSWGTVPRVSGRGQSENRMLTWF